MTPEPIEIAVIGDVHGAFDAALDGGIVRRFPLGLCTGDLTPNRGRDRFDDALRIGKDLADLEVRTILGNHDGPTSFTGRSFPKSYQSLCALLGDFHVGGRVIDFPGLDLSLVGARPLSTGGPTPRFAPPGREDWTIERWGEELLALCLSARQSRIVILAHCGPTGLGVRRHDIYGCDFHAREGDWGDPDLRLALDGAKAHDLPIVAVVAGHMHHALLGGGERARTIREGPTLHVNAAIVPREGPRGRAITVLRLEGLRANAEVQWHRADGSVEREEPGAEIAEGTSQ